MRINAQMIYKQEEIQPEACTVDDVIDLPAPEYLSLRKAFMRKSEAVESNIALRMNNEAKAW